MRSCARHEKSAVNERVLLCPRLGGVAVGPGHQDTPSRFQDMLTHIFHRELQQQKREFDTD